MTYSCKLCGNTLTKLRHRKQGSVVNSSSFEKVEDEYITSSEYDFYYQLKAKKDHLEIHCTACRYIERK